MTRFDETSPYDVELARELLRAILGTHSHVLEEEGMHDTPKRMLTALTQLTSGYDIDPKDFMRVTFPAPAEGHSGVVVVRDVPFSSLCEHHVLPFTGTVSVAYLPSERIVGLSKIPRMVRAYSRRLQVQERLTNQIAEAFEPLEPRGVAVMVRGRHSCCALRGVEAEAEMVTSRYTGCWDEAGVVDQTQVAMRQLIAMQRAEITRLLIGG